MSLETSKLGIIGLRPIAFFGDSGSAGTNIGILNEDGVPDPDEFSTEAVDSAFAGGTIAHIRGEGEKTIELTRVGYDKNLLSVLLPNVYSVDGVNGIDPANPLKGNLTRKLQPGVAPQKVLIIKYGFINANGTVTWDNNSSDDKLDQYYYKASLINISGVEKKGTDTPRMTMTFGLYPDLDTEKYWEIGKGIDESTMTYTPPAV